jgi:hypothetical protein
LAIGKIQNSKSKIIKIVYVAYICLGTYIVYISLSRAPLLLFVASIFVYVSVCSIQKFKINKKRLIVAMTIILTIVVVAVVYIVNIGLVYSKPKEVNKKEWSSELKYNFNAGEKYTLELDINTTDYEYDENDKIQITIFEKNKYTKTYTLNKKVIHLSDEKKYINFIPKEDILYLKIQIKTNFDKTYVINKCYINGEEYIIKYKYLPSKIARAITSFGLKDDSVVQRLQFYNDCIKIAKNHFIIGNGGNTWKTLSKTVQDYPYSVKESHSYFFELLISYGVVGLALFLLIVIFIYVKLIKLLVKNKEKQKEKLAIMVGLGLLLLHSLFFDFNMSFLVILATVFEYFAILIYDDKSKCILKLSKYADYIVGAILAIVLITLVKADIAKYGNLEIKTKAQLCQYNTNYQYSYAQTLIKNDELALDELQSIMKKDAYFNQNEIYELYWNQLLQKKDTLTDEQFKKYAEFGIKQFKNVKPDAPKYLSQILKRANIMKNIVSDLSQSSENATYQNVKDEIKNIMQSEYETNSENIENTSIYINSESKYTIKQYNSIIMEISKL